MAYREIRLKDAKDFEICPFMSANQLVWNSTYNGCIKEKCALWSKKGKCCSLAKSKTKRKPSKYNLFVAEKIEAGMSLSEAANLWQEQKEANQ